MVESFQTRLEAIAASARVLVPAGPGPFPVIIQMHGCGGPTPNQMIWAQIGLGAGCAVIILDSLAFRGIGRKQAMAIVCTGLRLRGRERAGDLFAALAYARAQPWANPERLFAIGWSHGGWSILDALALRPAQYRQAVRMKDVPAEPLAGLTAAFVLYPYLGRAALAARQSLHHAPPIEAIVCARDRTVGCEIPLAALRRLHAAGAPVETHVFAHCTHDFDEPTPSSPGIRHDSTATHRAHALFQAFLCRHMGDGLSPNGARSHP